MSKDALTNRLRGVLYKTRIVGCDGNSIPKKSQSIRRRLGQVVECLNGIDRKCCSQTTIADVDPRGTVLIHPPRFPTTVFLLEIEEGPKVHFVSDANRCASNYTHGKG